MEAERKGEVPNLSTDESALLLYAESYYLTGRYAAVCGLVNAGPLLRDAVALLFRLAVLRKHLGDDAESLGDSLDELWARVESTLPSEVAGAFADTITRLQRFEAARLPVFGRPMVVSVGWGKDSDELPISSKTEHCYVSLTSVDHIFFTLMKSLQVDPVYIRGISGFNDRLINPVYEAHNLHKLW